MIYELTTYTPQQLHDIDTLMHALSANPHFDESTLQAVITTPDSHLYVLEKEGHLIGCATLCLFCSPTGRKASIEDVVILPTHQGHGLGRQLMEHLIHEAERHAPITLQLTSRPSRQAARALYKSLGFEPKETGFFKKNITITP